MDIQFSIQNHLMYLTNVQSLWQRF